MDSSLIHIALVLGLGTGSVWFFIVGMVGLALFLFILLLIMEHYVSLRKQEKRKFGSG